jgi:putative salt-induced outer membrane protein
MKQLKNVIRFVSGIFLLGCIAAGNSWAASWEGAVHVGLTATDGNSRTSSTNVSIEAQKKETAYLFRTGASTTYGRTEGETTTDKSSVVAQYNRFLTERLTGYLNVGADRDRIADLLWRLQIGPGIGYFFVKRTEASLVGDLGVTYFREKYENTTSDAYYALRVAERGEWKVSETAKIWEMVEYLPAFNDFTERYILKGEAGVDAAVTAMTNLRLLVQDTYNSAPAAGRKRNDVTYIMAFGFKFQ